MASFYAIYIYFFFCFKQEISFNAFDSFWYSMVEIYNIWIKMPSKISENIYNLLVNDDRNSAKLENITVYLKQVNERIKISVSILNWLVFRYNLNVYPLIMCNPLLNNINII